MCVKYHERMTRASPTWRMVCASRILKGYKSVAHWVLSHAHWYSSQSASRTSYYIQYILERPTRFRTWYLNHVFEGLLTCVRPTKCVAKRVSRARDLRVIWVSAKRLSYEGQCAFPKLFSINWLNVMLCYVHYVSNVCSHICVYMCVLVSHLVGGKKSSTLTSAHARIISIRDAYWHTFKYVTHMCFRTLCVTHLSLTLREIAGSSPVAGNNFVQYFASAQLAGTVDLTGTKLLNFFWNLISFKTVPKNSPWNYLTQNKTKKAGSNGIKMK
jgi:hypothetical protein